jgi:hypothetical protein
MAVQTPTDTNNKKVDHEADQPVRALGLDPMLPNAEHAYSIDATDNSPAAFNLRGALEQGGLMAGVNGGRNDDYSNLTPAERAERDATTYATLTKDYAEAEFDYAQFEEDMREAQEELSAQLQLQINLDIELKLQQDLVLLQHQDEIKPREENIEALDLTAADIEKDIYNRYDQLAAIGLPDNVLHATHYKDPNACSRGDADLAVNYDETSKKFFYMKPDGSKEEVTEPMAVASLKSQLENGAVSADKLTGADARRIKDYTQIAGELQTSADKLLTAWKEVDAARTELEEFKQKLFDEDPKIKELKEQIANNNAEIEQLKQRIATDQAGMADAKARMTELEQKAKDMGVDLESAKSQVLSQHNDETLAYQQKVNDAQKNFLQVKQDALDSYENAIGDMADMKDILKENKVMFVTRDIEVRDDKGKVVQDESGYPVTKHLELPVQEDERGYFYTDPYGERKTVAPVEVSYALANGSKTVQDLKGDTNVQTLVRGLESANEKIMKSAANADAATEEGLISRAQRSAHAAAHDRAKMQIDSARNMMGSMSEERAQFLTAEDRFNKAIEGKNSISQSDLDHALLSVDPENRAEVRERLLSKQDPQFAVIDDTSKNSQTPKIFSGTDPVPQSIAAVDPNTPVVQGSVTAAATRVQNSNEKGLTSLTDTGAFGRAVEGKTAETDPQAKISADATAKLDSQTAVPPVPPPNLDQQRPASIVPLPG